MSIASLLARRDSMSLVGQWRWAAALSGSLVVALAAPPVAQAQQEQAAGKSERNAARDSYNKGTAAYESGDYVAALDAFVQANALIPSAQALFWIARCQDQLGKREAAIEAYDQLIGRADFAKLSADKQATSRERLAALKANPAAAPAAAVAVATPPPAEATTPAAPAAAPQSAAAPPPADPPPPAASVSREEQFLPTENLVEIGFMGGVMWLSKQHNLAEEGKEPHKVQHPVWEGGVRVGYFPSRYLGIEAEWTHGVGTIDQHAAKDSPEDERKVKADLLRAHVVGQWPSYFIVPFAQLGTGFIHAQSDLDGSDTDLLFDVGVGAKVMAHEFLVPRIDLRMNFTQAKGGGMTDGIAASPELLIGLDFVLDH
jgi:hypothetical protein